MQGRLLKGLTALAAAFLLAGPGQAAAQPADAVYLHGNILTVDEAQPKAEAVAVRDGRIVAVGLDRDIEKLRGPRTRT